MSKARDLANAGTALTTVSATELGYLDGVTSAVQTQIDSKIGQSTAINPSIVTTKGDILVATGSGTIVRQGVGTNGQLLSANSAQADGVEWIDAPAAGSLTLLSTTTLSGTSTTISSINQSYKQLLIIGIGIYASGNNTNIRPIFNSDSGSNYDRGGVAIEGGSVNSWATSTPDTYLNFNSFMGSGTLESEKTSLIWNLYNYTSTGTKHGYVQTRGIYTPSSSQASYIGVTRYYGASAISSITFNIVGGNTFSGGTIQIYGVN